MIKITRLNKKKRGHIEMTNELIKSFIGKFCNIYTGSFGTSYQKVTIVDVVDNWIKVDNKGKIDLLNTDYIQNIKILTEK